MFSFIIAIDSEKGIGNDGTIPWNCHQDLVNFRKLTLHHPVIMGRKTWDSLPEYFKPLPKRFNIVLSESLHRTDVDDGVIIMRNLNQLLSLIKTKDTEWFVIGGSQLYNVLWELNLVNKVYLTVMHKSYDCDTFVNFGLDNFKNSTVWSLKSTQKFIGADFYVFQK